MDSEPMSPNDELAVAILQQGMKDIQEYRSAVNKTYMAYCAAMVTGRPPPDDYLCPKEKESESKPETANA